MRNDCGFHFLEGFLSSFLPFIVTYCSHGILFLSSSKKKTPVFLQVAQTACSRNHPISRQLSPDKLPHVSLSTFPNEEPQLGNLYRVLPAIAAGGSLAFNKTTQLIPFRSFFLIFVGLPAGRPGSVGPGFPVM